jgi:multisubunit Na+/H+ antiporter MnhB subunit
VLFGIVYELVTLKVGSRAKPLTKVARRRVLGRATGAAAVVGFFTWMIFHWGFSPGGGLIWLDAVVTLVGAGLGWLGYGYRKRQLEKRQEQ